MLTHVWFAFLRNFPLNLYLVTLDVLSVFLWFFSASCYKTKYTQVLKTEGFFGPQVRICSLGKFSSLVAWMYCPINEDKLHPFENSTDILIETDPRHCLTIKKYPRNNYKIIRAQFNNKCYEDIHVEGCLTGRNCMLLKPFKHFITSHI